MGKQALDFRTYVTIHMGLIATETLNAIQAY